MSIRLRPEVYLTMLAIFDFVPAQAGTHPSLSGLDPRLRGDDETDKCALKCGVRCLT